MSDKRLRTRRGRKSSCKLLAVFQGKQGKRLCWDENIDGDVECSMDQFGREGSQQLLRYPESCNKNER